MITVMDAFRIRARSGGPSRSVAVRSYDADLSAIRRFPIHVDSSGTSVTIRTRVEDLIRSSSSIPVVIRVA